jgi:hypothetical protein
MMRIQRNFVIVLKGMKIVIHLDKYSKSFKMVHVA